MARRLYPTMNEHTAGGPARKEVLALAERMWNECPTVKPRWEDLGGVTQSVWIERAQAALCPVPVPGPARDGDPLPEPAPEGIAPVGQVELF